MMMAATENEAASSEGLLPASPAHPDLIRRLVRAAILEDLSLVEHERVAAALDDRRRAIPWRLSVDKGTATLSPELIAYLMAPPTPAERLLAHLDAQQPILGRRYRLYLRLRHAVGLPTAQIASQMARSPRSLRRDILAAETLLVQSVATALQTDIQARQAVVVEES